ncbi:hypothetical protein TNCV_937391 [Trichonephila clavipes]|nr:hypothetical protein TNCV_937391 [Trichonephila clavipes]
MGYRVDLNFFRTWVVPRLAKFGRRISLKNTEAYRRISRIATGGRVRDLVDVVGQLGNATRRRVTFLGVIMCPHNLGKGFGTHVEHSSKRALWPMGCPLTSRSSPYIRQAGLLFQIKHHATRLFCSCQRVSSPG